MAMIYISLVIFFALVMIFKNINNSCGYRKYEECPYWVRIKIKQMRPHTTKVFRGRHYTYTVSNVRYEYARDAHQGQSPDLVANIYVSKRRRHPKYSPHNEMKNDG
jgi:hypothetical protein